MSSTNQSAFNDNLITIYENRFQGLADYRKKIWRVLIDQWLSQWIRGKDSILDLGSGHGEFITQITCPCRYAMDLSPASADVLEEGVVFLNQDCSATWDLPSDSLAVVFTSNFFEHLLTKTDLKKTFDQAFRTLKPGGLLLALGPNIRLTQGSYWDFWDHHLPLTEKSITELGELCGFKVEKCYAATLPYSMSQGVRPPIWMLRLYLRFPPVWRLLGKQFFVVLKK